MGRLSRDHRHRPTPPSPRDKAFILTFVGTFVGMTLALAALVWVTDPAAVFGTGIVPPIVSADRDYKAALYLAQRPRPEVVLLGSSRVETLRPDCVTALTGRPAFNFGVNAGVAEDFLAIFRFMRSQPEFPVREIILGAEPEAFTAVQGTGRAYGRSRVLAPFVSTAAKNPDQLFSDLWSDASVRAAFRSLWHHGFDRKALPQESLRPDGFQAHPRWDDEMRRGSFPQQLRVLSSSRAMRNRYMGDAHLPTTGMAHLHRLLREARSAGVRVTAFVPPVHPALMRETSGTALSPLTAELVDFLRTAERIGLLRYVETRSLADFSGDSTSYYDAVHMTSGNADKLLAAIYPRTGHCAVQ